MKLSTPSWQVLQEYLLVNGFEWVKETYNLTDDLIESLLYGGALPTEESNQKKIDKVFKEDEGKGKKRMLSTYFEDHFIWDKPNAIHKRCMDAEDSEEYCFDKTDEFIDKWVESYAAAIDRDMKRNGNGMKSHGWSHGERVINKTTSKTSDDIVNETMMRIYLNGRLTFFKKIDHWVKRDHVEGMTTQNIDIEDYENNNCGVENNSNTPSSDYLDYGNSYESEQESVLETIKKIEQEIKNKKYKK